MATEQTIFEIDDKLRPAADTIARSLSRASSLAIYLAANGTMADVPNDDKVIEGTATSGRKGVRGSDLHLLVTLLGKLSASCTAEDLAAVLRIAVNVGG